jgi:hypothetical protein
MAKSNKHSNAEIATTIESEGLGYTIQHYYDADTIADPELADLWEKASEMLEEIQAFLEESVGAENEPELEIDDDEICDFGDDGDDN